MNERILKLAASHFPRDGEGNICATPEIIAEFAKLIVRKCMDVAKYHTPDTEECEYTWLIHNKIAKYFGVEE